jgi:hypothetical protein
MENCSQAELSNRDLVLGKNPLGRPSEHLLGHKGRRGFDFHGFTFRTSKELSTQNHDFQDSLRKAIFQSQKWSSDILEDIYWQ